MQSLRTQSKHEWPQVKSPTNPLIRVMARDDVFRRQVRDLASLLGVYAKLLFKLNPRTEGVVDPALDLRRDLGGADQNMEALLNTWCDVSALHREAAGLTGLTTPKAGLE